MNIDKQLLVEQFLQLQSQSMNIDKPHISYEECDWRILIYLSKINKCSLLLNNTVNKDPDFYGIDKGTLDKWNLDTIKEFMNSCAKYAEFKRVIEALSNNGIQGIILKGYVLAGLYPDLFCRYSSDLDIKFNKADKEGVHEVFTKGLGFAWNEADSKENVYLYYNNALLIEAHFTLWEDYHGENIDVLLSENLDSDKTLINVEIADGLEVTTLGPTEHLILQMFHIVKHFIVEGIESRYFTDISLYINKYKDSIDFKRFYRVFNEMHFADFCRMYFTICIERFGMDESILTEENRVHPDDEIAFLTDIVFNGKRDLSDNASYSLLGILSPYVNGGIKPEESKSKRTLQALFPSADSIDDKYSYCKKYHVLLPVAWVHRAIRTVYFKLTKGNEVYGVKDKIKESEYRIQMMKNAKIL